MTLRRVRHLGDAVLRKKATELKKIKADVRALIADMYETMEEKNGIGLAAPQIGISKRIFVVDVPHEDGVHERFALINPKIVKFSGQKETSDEGCLSIPGVHGEVARREGLVVAGLDQDGEEIEIEAEGLLARCIQHEIDHLDGVLFIDRAGIEEKEARRMMEEFLATRAEEIAAKSEN